MIPDVFQKVFAHVAIERALGPELSDRLLAYALAEEPRFRPALVDRQDQPPARDANVRVSATLPDLGAFGPLFEARMRELLPRLLAELRMSPFELARIELELAAHGDGAFFTRHVDAERLGNTRMISVVYYAHARPKGFTGGALRLHPLVTPPGGGHTDVAPDHNRLVAFPSWAPHEVLPVSCPSGRFADSRFAVNCWLHRRRR